MGLQTSCKATMKVILDVQLPNGIAVTFNSQIPGSYIPACSDCNAFTMLHLHRDEEVGQGQG